MNIRKEIEHKLKRCECGGKRKIKLSVKRHSKYIAECKNCGIQTVIVKDDHSKKS